MTGTGRRRREPAADDSDYATEQFSFVDDENTGDVINWLSFAETRTERRTERRRRYKNRLVALIVLLGVSTTAGAGYAGWRWWQQRRDAARDDAKSTSVLFQVRNSQNTAILSAVLIDDPQRARAVAVLVPPQLRVETTESGPQQFADTLALTGPSLSRDALTDLLGVPMDGSWVLDTATFTSLVNQLGGLEITVDATAAGNNKTRLPAGKARLSGEDALTYATYRGSGETYVAASRRFVAVLQELFARMPGRADMVVNLLDGLGILASSGLSTDQLATLLGRLAASTDANPLTTIDLPLRDERGGILDARAAAPIVSDLWGAAAPDDRADGAVRVMVEDATGKPTTPQAVRTALVNAGYRYLDGGVAQLLSESRSAIDVSDAMPDAREVGAQIALTLGLPSTAVRVVKDNEIIADVFIVLRSDFVP